MKIEISRSFSMKKQIKQYEPVEFFCAVKTEVESELGMESASAVLDQFCQAEVAKSLDAFLDNRKQLELPKTPAAPNPRMAEKGTNDAEHDVGITGDTI
jgi:hypothetical protein